MYSTYSSDESLSDEFERENNNFELSQWANEVVDFSCSYGSSISYSAVNICGRPSKFPAYGDFAECFSMRHYGPPNDFEREISSKDSQHESKTITFHDFIVVKYENYVLPKAIKIYETYNPGSIVRIFAYCCTIKEWRILWQAQAAPVEKKAREFCPPINKVNLPTRIIRIEFNHSLIDYYTGIDGVLLSGAKCKILVDRPLSEQAIIRGMIQKKLETVQFKPQKTPSEAIEDFLKNDLNKFIENVGLNAYAKDNDKSMPLTILESQTGAKEKQIGDIPYEILFNVMSFLDLRSLFQCSQVCSTFRNLVTDPLLYSDINLKFYWNHINSAFLKTLTPRCIMIRKLDMSSCGYFDSVKSTDFVEFIRANGKTITNLRLNSSQFLNTSCLESISTTCSNLTELSIRNYMHATTDRDFASLSLLTKLEILDLERSGIDTLDLFKILKSNPNLIRLNLAFSSHNVSMDEICICISAYNTKIKAIDMWKCQNLTAIGIRALSDCRTLEELDFGWCLREEASITESLKWLIQNCKNLNKLILAAIRGISERDLENIATYCRNLEILDLMGIVGVSSDMCIRILESCTKLRLLDVSFCENLDDVNVMIWRNQYNVCIKRSEVPNDG